VPGKDAVSQPITEKRAFYPGVAHKVRGCLIYFFGCNSRTNQIADSIEYVACGATCLPHLFDFPGVLDRDHFAVLSSINFEMSAKTASRSRLPSIRCKMDTFLYKAPSGSVLVWNSCKRVCNTPKSSSLRRSKRPSQYGHTGRLANCALDELVVKPHSPH